jgi:DNA polymerase III subunit chi
MSTAKPAVSFYHLTRSSETEALPRLVERALRDSYKIVVRASTPEKVDRLDAALWTYEKDSFLPHGTDRNGHADLQPVLLTTSADVPNRANLLILLDNILPDHVTAFERVIYMFDGNDGASVQLARDHWKDFRGRGLPLTYLQQSETGGWMKRAEA